jgi:antitoxin ParD1/3/4
MAEMVKSKVASGEYATESEVIRGGLRTLAARDAAVDRWLRDEVAPAYYAHKADPTWAVSLDEGMTQVRAEIAKGEGQR